MTRIFEPQPLIPFNAFFDKEKEQRRLREAQLISEIGVQAGSIARTEGEIIATNAANDKAAHLSANDRSRAKADWEKAHPGGKATEQDVSSQAWQNSYNQALRESGLGTGGSVQQAIQAAAAAVQGLAGGDIKAAIAGGAAPYLAEVIGHQSGLSDGGKVIAHAVVNTVLAKAQGNSAAAGAAGAAAGELAGMLAAEIYHRPVSELKEEEKQTVSALATAAAGLAGALTGGGTSGAFAGAQAGKTTVEFNWLNVQEAERKAVLERKEKAGAISKDEQQELAGIKQTDKRRDAAIKSVCTDGNKAGSACGALIVRRRPRLISMVRKSVTH